MERRGEWESGRVGEWEIKRLNGTISVYLNPDSKILTLVIQNQGKADISFEFP